MSGPKKVKATESSSTIMEILQEDGCVVLEQALDGGQVRQLQDELRPHFAQTDACQGDFYGYHTTRLSSLIARSSMCQDMAIKPPILDIMDHFLLQSCTDYQLNLTQAIRIGPGEDQQFIHADDLMFPFEHPGRQAMINCMWAVDDFTKENGATHVVLGSHHWDRERRPEPDQVVQAEMEAGSVLVYFAQLLHGGGANRSARPRTGVVLSYCLGWLRQAENQYLAVPLETARELPERLQKLIGYFVHEPNLGCLEGQDPIRVLQGKELVGNRFEEFLPEEAKAWLAEYKKETAKAA